MTGAAMIFAPPGASALAGFNGRFYCGDVATKDHRQVRSADLLLADELDIGGFEHRVGGFENGGHSLGFGNAEGFGGVFYRGFEIQ